MLSAILNDLNGEYKGSYEVYGAGSANEAMEMIDLLEADGREIAMFLADQRMPKVSGVQFLSRIRARYPNSMRAILTGYADKENAIEAINLAGVQNYFVKPWNDHKDRIFKAINAMLLEFTTGRMNRIELKSAQESINNIFKITLMSEMRDEKLRGHSIRVAIYSHFIGSRNGLQGDALTELCEHALIHDVGMVASPPLKYITNPHSPRGRVLEP